MDNNFVKGLEFIRKWEGGWSNDKLDPGGKTMWGITEAVYLKHYPNNRIEDATPDEAANIYWEDYWLPSGAGEVPFYYGIVLFDTAVNCGVGRAKALDRIAKGDPEAYINARIQFYTRVVEKNPPQKKFFKGWINRVTDLRKYVDVLRIEANALP